MRNSRVTVIVLMSTLFLSGNLLFVESSSAQNDRSPKPEIWYGVLDIKVQKLRLEIRVREKSDGSLEGGMVSLDQSPKEFPFNSLERTDKVLNWSIDSLGASFQGKLNDDKDQATGNYKQGPVAANLVLKKVANVPQRKLVQVWQGDMKTGVQTFEFQFRVFEDADGGQTVLLDSFTESIEGLNCSMDREGDEVTIKIPITAAKFVGKINKAQDTIAGTWIQRGNEIPLTVHAVALTETRKLEINRPQTPKPPFDYDAEDLEIENKAGKSVLAGTLTTPKGNGPFITVILISGSGPQDRNETIANHQPFAVIADHLTNAGIAVFRFDDRGIAKSKGDFGSATTRDFASDVGAIVESLKTHPKVDPQRMVLAGHSEGGIIAPLVASQRSDVAGIVLLAGTGVTGKAISLNQSRKISSLAGMPPEMVDAQEVLLGKMYDRIEQGEEFDAEFLKQLGVEVNEGLPESMRNQTMIDAIVAKAKLQMDSPWFKFFAFHDPAPVLEKVTQPVLVIIGEKDVQVDPDLNLPPIEAALEKAGNNDVEVNRMPNLNHLFQNCRTGSPAEYNQIEETISPEVLNKLTEWLQSRFN